MSSLALISADIDMRLGPRMVDDQVAPTQRGVRYPRHEDFSFPDGVVVRHSREVVDDRPLFAICYRAIFRRDLIVVVGIVIEQQADYGSGRSALVRRYPPGT